MKMRERKYRPSPEIRFLESPVISDIETASSNMAPGIDKIPTRHVLGGGGVGVQAGGFWELGAGG